jgi:diguanylate cyclase (GGDEF)-like protein
MRVFFNTSIVFRLWLALSLVATAVIVAALSMLIWLAIKDDIASVHKETEAKVDALVATAGDFSANGMVPLDRATFDHLGIISVEILDRNGVVSRRQASDIQVSGPFVNSQLLAKASESRTSRTLRLDGNVLVDHALSPLDIIKGGWFAEEQILPITLTDPERQGYMRFLMGYPDLPGRVQDLILRFSVLAIYMVAALLLGMWPFLLYFVSRPLRRYSMMAMQIAIGQPVRMPATGARELSELGRAVNSMADALEYKATVDALTGLYNLRHLSSHLEALIAEAGAKKTPLCVIVGDLDNLKPINDTYGHLAGDRVLKSVSLAIRTWAGPDYTCWRMGGDEFVVALPGIDEKEGGERAEQMRRTVASVAVPVSDTLVCPSISVGIASYPADGMTAGALLGVADSRMYTAKARQLETAA